MADALTGIRLIQVKEDMERRMYESKLKEAQMGVLESRGYIDEFQIENLP